MGLNVGSLGVSLSVGRQRGVVLGVGFAQRLLFGLDVGCRGVGIHLQVLGQQGCL